MTNRTIFLCLIGAAALLFVAGVFASEDYFIPAGMMAIAAFLHGWRSQ